MHYIVGTEIIAPASKSSGKIKPGMTSSQIRALSTRGNADNEQLSKLTPGVKYTLARIYTENDMFVYKFIGTQSIVLLEFTSIQAAERFIAETRGESVTSYEHVYNSMTD